MKKKELLNKINFFKVLIVVGLIIGIKSSLRLFNNLTKNSIFKGTEEEWRYYFSLISFLIMFTLFVSLILTLVIKKIIKK